MAFTSETPGVSDHFAMITTFLMGVAPRSYSGALDRGGRAGTNNRARRAAKRRRHRGNANTWRRDPGHPNDSARPSAADEAATELTRLLAELIASALHRNWTPTDLTEITRRKLSMRHVELVALLVAQAGRGELVDLAAEVFPIARAVAALLRMLPPIPDVTQRPKPGRHDGENSASAGVLAKVRALLAKAESTEFPAEAEALSAKAQELIATCALDRYAAQLDGPGPDGAMTVRRLWIDAPYVEAKSLLVDAVAEANHCKAVLSTYFGFVTLIGQASDVDAVELLVTSLQVQANRAMLRHGRIEVRAGESRTRSFRKAFLVSYASRIRERLRQTTSETLVSSGRSSELVPVMARHDERVRAVTAELFPEIETRRTTISNREGWMAGRAAADLARLDIREPVTREATA